MLVYLQGQLNLLGKAKGNLLIDLVFFCFDVGSTYSFVRHCIEAGLLWGLAFNWVRSASHYLRTPLKINFYEIFYYFHGRPSKALITIVERRKLE